jgi:hypothetical protein
VVTCGGNLTLSLKLRIWVANCEPTDLTLSCCSITQGQGQSPQQEPGLLSIPALTQRVVLNQERVWHLLQLSNVGLMLKCAGSKLGSAGHKPTTAAVLVDQSPIIGIMDVYSETGLIRSRVEAHRVRDPHPIFLLHSANVRCSKSGGVSMISSEYTACNWQLTSKHHWFINVRIMAFGACTLGVDDGLPITGVGYTIDMSTTLDQR